MTIAILPIHQRNPKGDGMKKQIHLEGSLIVEMKDGRQRVVTCTPFDGKVRHTEAGVAFGFAEVTDEAEFRGQIQRVISRSSYDKR